jgi:hypothetical protein
MSIWKKRERPLHDGREVWVDDKGRELIQRPWGEWTIKYPAVPFRSVLGTWDLEDAKHRVDAWTDVEWKFWRKNRLPQIRCQCKEPFHASGGRCYDCGYRVSEV